MKIEKTTLEGVKLVKPEVFEDFRGRYVTITNEKEYPWKFLEHCISTSSKGVLRGIHLDPDCDKLLTVMHGAIYYVVVDVDTGQWESFILSGENHYQILKPRKYGAGFLALTNNAVFYHANSEHYDPRRQKTFRWDEPRFNIYWPISSPILSERDKHADYIPPISCPHGPVGSV